MNIKKPYFVAEISANHLGSFKRAKKLILCAKQNGADAVKLQTYSPGTMTIKSKHFKINHLKDTICGIYIKKLKPHCIGIKLLIMQKNWNNYF